VPSIPPPVFMLVIGMVSGSPLVTGQGVLLLPYFRKPVG